MLSQAVYPILAGYPDGNDAQQLRDEPLFLIRADVCPDADNPLASGSTLARLPYAYTRRQAELPPGERPVLPEVRDAPIGRLKSRNDSLIDLFVRTRHAWPQDILLAVDASDDPVHGQQTLRGSHGYYRPHPELPLFVYEGATGLPLAAWLRPATLPASLDAGDILDALVRRLRAAWPEVRLQVRSDNGLAVPSLYA